MYGSFSLILKHNIPRPQPQKCRWDTKESFPSIASLWSSVIGFCYIGGKKFQDWTRTGSGPGFDLADRQNLHIYRWWQTDDAVWPIDSKPQVAYSKPQVGWCGATSVSYLAHFHFAPSNTALRNMLSLDTNILNDGYSNLFLHLLSIVELWAVELSPDADRRSIPWSSLSNVVTSSLSSILETALEVSCQHITVHWH